MTTARAIANLTWVHATTVKMTQDWPAAKETFQTAPTDNHLLWTLGHLAATYDWFRGLLVAGPSELPESYQKLFGYKSVPLADRAAYSSTAELRAAFDKTFASLVAAASALSADDAAKAPLSETGGFCADRLDAIDKAAWHDGWHAGQLAPLRKALGLPSVTG